MHALTVVAAFLGGGAAVTFIGAKLIERARLWSNSILAPAALLTLCCRVRVPALLPTSSSHACPAAINRRPGGIGSKRSSTDGFRIMARRAATAFAK